MGINVTLARAENIFGFLRRRKKECNRTARPRWGESGNVFFTLFGAVALVGVVGATTSTLMRGPVGTVIQLNQRAKADAQMQIAQKLSMLAAAQEADSGDCDSDGYVEPLGFAACTGSGPAGGGCIPNAIGSAKMDPWGTEYGYCAWDHGPVNDDSVCSRGNLSGKNENDRTVVAIISAGANRIFNTTCNAYVNDSTDLVANSGDDLVLEFTYAEAVESSGGLWRLQSGDPDTAEIDKDIEVSGQARFGSAQFSGPSVGFDLGTELNLEAGALLKLPDQVTSGVCGAANDGVLRIDYSSGRVLQLCHDGVGWTDVGGSGATSSVAGADGDVQYNDGGAFGGEAAFNYDAAADTLTVPNIIANTDLQVDGNTTLGDAGTDTVSIAGNTTIGGTLGVTGATTLGTLGAGSTTLDSLGVTNNATVGGTLGVTGTATLSGNATVGGTLGVTGVATMTDNLVVNGTTTDLNSDLEVSGTSTLTGNTSVGGTLDVTGVGTFTSDVDVGGDVFGNAFRLTGDGGNNDEGMYYSSAGNGLELRTQGNTRLEIDAAGDIGINLGSAPTTDVDIGGVIRLRQMGETAGANCSGLHGAITYSSGDELLVCSDLTGNWETIGTSGGGGGGTAGLWDEETNYIRRETSTFIVDEGAGLPLAGAGTRLMWYPNKSAFRAGQVTGTQWNDTNVGNNSTAFGLDAQADGDRSFAAGYRVYADGNGSVALGYDTRVNNANSMAIGLGDSSPVTPPQVSASSTLGIFMGDQDGLNLTSANLMMIAGGRLLIDPGAPATQTNTSGSLDLDVEGDVGAINFCDENGANCFTAQQVATGSVTAPGVDRQVIFNSGGALNATSGFVFTSAGRLGVGTDVPQTPLHIAGVGTFDDNILMTGTGAIKIPDGLIGDRPAGQAGMLRFNSSSNAFEGYNGTDWNGFMTGSAGSDRELLFNSGGAVTGSPNLVFTSAGNIGIGDATPDSGTGGQLKLDVAGNAGANQFCDENGDNCFTAASVSGGDLGNPGDDREIFFNSNGELATNDNFVFSSLGRLGVGVTAPDNDLDIDGTAEVTGAVTLGGTLDVAGATAIANTFDVTGGNAASLSGTLGVTGVASFAEDVRLKDGLATDPALTFTNDQDTGLFSAGADDLGFALGGSELIRFNSAGQIGIGDLTPDSGTGGQLMLDVAGNIGGNEYCDEAGDDCFTAADIASLSSSSQPGDPDRGIQFNSGSEFTADANFVYTSTGYLGLGTASPDNPIHIVDNNDEIEMGSNGGGGIAISLKDSGDTAWSLNQGHSTDTFKIFQGNNQRMVFDGNPGTAETRIAIGDDNSPDAFLEIVSEPSINVPAFMISGTTDGDLLYVSRTGFIGVGGITSPQTVFDVGGTIKMAYGGEACDASHEGAIHFDSNNNEFKICATSGSWDTIATGASASPGDPDRGVQFNSGGEFTADANFVYTSTGYLGVANSGPADIMEVGTIADMRLLMQHNGITADPYNMDLDATARDRVIISSEEGTYHQALVFSDIGTDTDDTFFGISSSSDSGSSWDPRFVIHQNGRVGIGTNAPANDAHIHDSASGSSAEALLRITTGDTGALDSDGIAIGYNNDAGDQYGFVWLRENEDMRLATNDIERMRIDPDGIIRFQSTGAAVLNTGTTGQRPDAAENGMIRYNTDNDKFEAYQGGAWEDIITSAVGGGAADPDRGVQFNSGGEFTADAAFAYNSTGRLTLGTNATFEPALTLEVAQGTGTTPGFRFVENGDYSAFIGYDNSGAAEDLLYQADIDSDGNGGHIFQVDGSTVLDVQSGNAQFGFGGDNSLDIDPHGVLTLGSTNAPEPDISFEFAVGNGNTPGLRFVENGDYSAFIGYKNTSGDVDGDEHLVYNTDIDADGSGAHVFQIAGVSLLSLENDGLIRFQSTGAAVLNTGTTGQRPDVAENGMIRYNTDNDKFEAYQGGAWEDIITSAVGGGAADPDRGIQFKSGTGFAADANFVFTSAGNLQLVGRLDISDQVVGSNVFIGGGNDTASGNSLTALGVGAAASLTSAIHGTYIGHEAGTATTIGNGNTFIGKGSGATNTEGQLNTFVGLHTGSKNDTGDYNVYIGHAAGFEGIDANRNVAMGRFALNNFTGTGDTYNVAIGYEAMDGSLGSSTGVRNVALGSLTGSSITTGSDNVLIGHDVEPPTGATSNYINIGDIFYGSMGTGELFIGSNGALRVPVGPDGARPGTLAGTNAAAGMIRYNSTSNVFEGHNGSTWNGFVAGAAGNDREMLFNSAGQFATDSGFVFSSLGRLGIGTNNPRVTFDVVATDAAILPAGNDSTDRPAGIAGMIRYNTDANAYEYYNGSQWNSLSACSGNCSGEAGILGDSMIDSSPSRDGDVTTGFYSPAADTVGVATDGDAVMRWLSAANAVNYFEVTPAITGENPVLSVDGTDSDIGMMLMPKGEGYVTVGGLGALLLPAGLDGDRPSSPEAGMIRYNSTSDQFEGYVQGLGWDPFATGTPSAATPDRGIQFNSGGNFAAVSDFVYTSAGRFGIGTDAPSTSLHINGTSGVLIDVGTVSATQLETRTSSGAKLIQLRGNDIEFAPGDFGSYDVNLFRGGNDILRTNDLFIADSGIGVGLLYTSAALDVDGTIKMAYGGEACDAGREGAIHYDSGGDEFYVCRTSGSWDLLATGTATTPGDPDRGIQFNSGNAFTADANFVYTSLGHLGLGTGAPEALFHVQGDAGENPLIRMDVAENTQRFFNMYSNDGTELFDIRSHLDHARMYLKDDTGNTRFTVNANEAGGVVIGSYTAGSELQDGAADVFGAGMLIAFPNGAGNENGIAFNDSTTNSNEAGAAITYYDTDGSVFGIGGLRLKTNATGNLTNGLTTRMEISPDGLVRFTSTGAIVLPAGTDGMRPDVAEAGMIRYNSTSDQFEGYVQGLGWDPFATGTPSAATPDRGIQFNSGGEFTADANFTYTSVGDFIVGSYQTEDTGNSAEDNRMFFDKSKGAFRAGYAASTEWDDANVGGRSIAMGGNVTASGDFGSIALGYGAEASGETSVALGGGTASANYSFAFNGVASGSNSTAIGEYPQASGIDAIAIGEYPVSSGLKSIALGHTVTASGAKAMAFNDKITVSGDSSVGFGLVDNADNPATTVGTSTSYTISGTESVGFFMGDPGTSIDLTADNTFAVFGGNVIVDPRVPAANLSPDTALEVEGTIKMAYGGEACDASREGAIHFDSSGNNFYFCADAGNGWESVSLGSGVSVIDDLSDAAVNYTSSNFFMGQNVGGNITSGFRNTAVGVNTALNITDGRFNASFGYRSLENGNGEGNTAIGAHALNQVNGNYNVGLGYLAGDSVTAGSNNIFIGYDIDAPDSNISNYLNIGDIFYGSMGTGEIYIGGSGALKLPDGTDAQRPGTLAGTTAAAGMIRYNSSSNVFEGYNGSDWNGFLAGAPGGAGDDREVIFNSGGQLATYDAFVFDSAGHLGLGTDAPQEGLHVQQGNIFSGVSSSGSTLIAAGEGTGPIDSGWHIGLRYDIGSSANSTRLVTGTSTNLNLDAGTGLVRILGTGALELPAGLDGDRPSSPVAGMIRYNSTSDQFEGYVQGLGWDPFATGTPTAATPDRGIQFNSGGNFAADSALTYSSTGVLMVGATDPTDDVGYSDPHMIVSSASGDLWLRTFSNNAGDKLDLDFMKAGGSEASPTAVSDGDSISRIRWGGYDGDSYELGPQIYAEVNGTVSGGNVPMDLHITSAADERIRITATRQNFIEATSLGEPDISFSRYGGGDFGSTTPVSSGDILGKTLFYGHDGTDVLGSAGTYGAYASIYGIVDGTVADNNVPTDLVFATSPTGRDINTVDDIRMRIESDGLIRFSSTGAIVVPRGDTAQRPDVAEAGMIRFNSATGFFEGHNGSIWQDINTGSGGLWTDNTTHISYQSSHIIKTGQTTTTAGLDGDGKRMFFDPDNGALRGGEISGGNDAWQNGNIGSNSFAWGPNAQASSTAAIALGSGVTAGGNTSIAMGNDSSTGSNYSIAIGHEVSAGSGGNSNAVAIGDQSTASAGNSIAIGDGLTASGDHSIALGRLARVGDGNPDSGFGDHSMVIGLGKTGSSPWPQVTGQESMAIFMGDQQGMDLTYSSTFGLFGGKMIINPDAPTDTDTQADTALEVKGTVKLNRVRFVSAGGAAAPVSASSASGGSGTVQFNSGGALASNNSFYWDDVNAALGIGTQVPDDAKIEVANGTVCVDTNGDGNATSCITSESDIRLKKNVTQIDGALGKLRRLRGVEFDWRWDEFSHIKRYQEKSHAIGVIAQEVEKVFPEAMGEDYEGYKTVEYRYLVAPIIEAIKELDTREEDRFTTLARENAELKQKVSALEQDREAVYAELNDINDKVKGLQAHTGYGIEHAGFWAGYGMMALIALISALGTFAFVSVMNRRRDV